jgi:hypothetical protein
MNARMVDQRPRAGGHGPGWRAVSETFGSWGDLFDDVVWIGLAVGLGVLALHAAPDAQALMEAVGFHLPHIAIDLDR